MKRRRRPQEPNRCRVRGCGRAIERWKRICGGCWSRLPFERRRAIAEAGQARAPHIVAKLSAEAVAWLDAQPPSGAALAARICGSE